MTLADDGYVSVRPGALPENGEASVEGVRLPRGHQVGPDPSYVREGSAPVEPVLWITDDPVPNVGQLWADLQQRFPRSGLWPVVLEALEGEPGRPWDAGELNPSASSPPDGTRAEAVLSRWWSEAIPVEEEEEEAFEDLAPFSRTFPGVAPATTGPVNERAPHLAVSQMTGRLGLVGVRRPADAVAVLGWQGAVNYHEDMGQLAAVLRSWEDRFGAVVVGMGFDTLTMGVRRPPTGENETAAVAAEHFAACPDLVWQGAGTIADYATEIDGRAAWLFWLD